MAGGGIEGGGLRIKLRYARFAVDRVNGYSVQTSMGYAPTLASTKTTMALTSSRHLMRNPPFSVSHSLKMF